ncbi:MFS transporter [Asaia siamensis]|uniref:MFS transporter n=1 Tax=Asaia siamensis TaxID=110479 RepID=A0ABQ1LX21_9PROT|nr:MFS transporter [Asaia siamensis]GBR02757.1 major facilitator superfamily arabinose transmembrane efflux protein [Asaia siamensis NRIC 0323]GGC30969.1 hypothetical protein GCM10007207_15630 [Asaia siamensis]
MNTFLASSWVSGDFSAFAISPTVTVIPLTVVIFLIGASGGLSTVVQSRLLSVATGSEGLAAALNQSAFNTANAIGPWLGGLAVAHDLGWTSVGWVGLALSLSGFIIFLLSLAEEAWSKQARSRGA